jgi:ubiquinone biosynthesis accessory factor UbiK
LRRTIEGPARHVLGDRPFDRRQVHETFNPALLLDSAVSAHPLRHKESPVLNPKSFDELAAAIGRAIENSPAKDIEKNIKAMLAAGLARLDLVPRAEFDVQAQVLLKTREKLEALEKRVAELESRNPSTVG